MDGAASAWVADVCNRVVSQELLPDEEKVHADLVQEAEPKDLAAWKKFDVYAKRNACNVSKKIAQTRWVLTWKIVDGREFAKARQEAKGFQGPDLRVGVVDTSGCVRLRSSHLQVISLCAIKNGNF